jgi:hypothetical protein
MEELRFVFRHPLNDASVYALAPFCMANKTQPTVFFAFAAVYFFASLRELAPAIHRHCTASLRLTKTSITCFAVSSAPSQRQKRAAAHVMKCWLVTTRQFCFFTYTVPVCLAALSALLQRTSICIPSQYSCTRFRPRRPIPSHSEQCDK